jgi:aminoglycoside phosphotransferase (APT) family kinase protein
MDAKLDNLLLDVGGRRAVALIDWDMGTLGPPAFDLAVVLSYWIEPGDPAACHALGAMPTLEPGWPGRVAMVAAYAAAAGGVPEHLGWHLGLARLRLAVAWMQLYRLWQRGALAGGRYAGFETLAVAIAEQAVTQFGDAP